MAEEIKFKGLTIGDAEREFTKDFGPKLGSFTVKIPLPFQKTQIMAITSRVLNGAPVESLRAQDYEYARMVATLDFVISKSPDWWSEAGNCPDDDFLMKLWDFYIDSEQKFFEFLKKN